MSTMNKKGFTLLEIMVSVTILSVAMVIGVGAIISVNDVSRRTRSIQASMDNMNFAIESMVREMRLGHSYHCGTGIGVTDSVPDSDTPTLLPEPTKDCSMSSEGDFGVTFVNSGDKQIAYELKHVGDAYYLGRSEYSTIGEVNQKFEAMTSPVVSNDKLTIHFYVSGSTPGDGEQPKVIITISGQANIDKKTQTTFTIQTTATQRNVDS